MGRPGKGSEPARVGGPQGGSLGVIILPFLPSSPPPPPPSFPAASTPLRCAGPSLDPQALGSLGGWSGLLDHISHRFPALGPPTLSWGTSSHPVPFPKGQIPERITQLSL